MDKKKLSKQVCNTGRTNKVFGLFPLRQRDGLPSHLVSTWRIKPESLPLSVFVHVSVVSWEDFRAMFVHSWQCHADVSLAVAHAGIALMEQFPPCQRMKKRERQRKRKRDTDWDWIVHEKTFLCSFVGFLKNWRKLDTQRGVRHLFLELGGQARWDVAEENKKHFSSVSLKS